jgi:hypothetical protein
MLPGALCAGTGGFGGGLWVEVRHHGVTTGVGGAVLAR